MAAVVWAWAVGGMTILQAAEPAPAPGPEAKAEIKRLKDWGGLHYVQWSMFTPQRKARFTELKTDAELETMRVEYLRSLEKILKLDPTDWATRNHLGVAFLCENKPDPAIDAFEAVLRAEGPDPAQKANARLGMASAMFLKNDTAAMIRWLKELAAMGLPSEQDAWRGPRRYFETSPVDQAKSALRFLDGVNVDDFKLPQHTGAKPFPAPREAVFEETFIPLKTLTLALGGGLKPEDVRVDLLRQKLTRFGIELAVAADAQPRIGAGGFTVRLNLDKEPVAPDHPQGYALAVTREGAVINGRDALGTTWGVVSLIQLLDPTRKAIRVCRIADWPDVINRADRGGLTAGTLEHALFSKMDVIVTDGLNEYRSPITRAAVNAASRQMAAFGIRHYVDIKNLIEPQLFPLTSERTYAFHREVFDEIAANRGNVLWNYDDNRFPMHPRDVEISGTAAKQDAAYLGRLFADVKKAHPDFEMLYCPPYYWGPYYSFGLDRYPERTRDAYLTAIGEHMNQPGLRIFWTGHRVVSYRLRKADMDWITARIKQKPAYWQNRPGPHNAYNYITDEMTGFRDWYYDGFYGDIGFYYLNTSVQFGASMLSAAADCLWNVKGYDPKRSIRQAVAMLYGEKMFDILHPVSLELGKLDKYKYGRITPEALTEIPELARIAAFVETRWKQAKAYNPEALREMPGYVGAGVGFAKAIVAAAKGKPDFRKLYAKAIADSRARAEKEIGLDPKAGDLFISPADCVGPTILRGAQTEGLNRVRFPFAAAPGVGYDLHLCGEQEPEFWEGDPVAIRISLNGATVYEGPCKLPFRDVKTATFALPADNVKAQNTVDIEMVTDGMNPHAGPFAALYAVVLKKTK